MLIFTPKTKGAWVQRFDNIRTDELELDAFRDNTISFSADTQTHIADAFLDGVLPEVMHTLIGYYIANKPKSSDWVMLPTTNFDAYFSNTNFSRKWFHRISPETVKAKFRRMQIFR